MPGVRIARIGAGDLPAVTSWARCQCVVTTPPRHDGPSSVATASCRARRCPATPRAARSPARGHEKVGGFRQSSQHRAVMGRTRGFYRAAGRESPEEPVGHPVRVPRARQLPGCGFGNRRWWQIQLGRQEAAGYGQQGLAELTTVPSRVSSLSSTSQPRAMSANRNVRRGGPSRPPTINERADALHLRSGPYDIGVTRARELDCGCRVIGQSQIPGPL